MGEEVWMSDYDGGDEERVFEWEAGLPSAEDLTPLSASLIPPELASAFSITPEPRRSVTDVNRASQSTLSSLRRPSQAFLSCNLKSLPSFAEDRSRDPVVVEGDEQEPEIEPGSPNRDAPEARKVRRLENAEEANSSMPTENSNEDQSSARTLKRPRLVWTPQLHKRFVDVVAHLGIKNAVPKTIMQLMNVEGLTRENVASHLQKYRLYLKRMQGLPNEEPSSSDHYLFASTPVTPSLHESGGQGHVPIPMPPMMHMPVLGVPPGHGHMGMAMDGNPVANPVAYHGFDPHHYNVYREQQRDMSGHKYGSLVPHSHVAPNNK